MDLVIVFLNVTFLGENFFIKTELLNWEKTTTKKTFFFYPSKIFFRIDEFKTWTDIDLKKSYEIT